MKSNLLAVRVEPWQLFRFKQFVKHRRARPGIVLQEALQIYFRTIKLPKDLEKRWLDLYHEEKRAGHEASLD